jgi:hypothetical protein
VSSTDNQQLGVSGTGNINLTLTNSVTLNSVLVPNPSSAGSGKVLKTSGSTPPFTYGWEYPDVSGSGSSNKLAIWNSSSDLTYAETTAARGSRTTEQLFYDQTTYTKIDFNTCSTWSSSTTCSTSLDRFTPTKAGTYKVTATFKLYGDQNTAHSAWFRFYKGTTAIGEEWQHNYISNQYPHTITISDIFDLAAYDTIELRTMTPASYGHNISSFVFTIERTY